MTAIERISIVGWFLHEKLGMETFTNDALRKCFREMQTEPPAISVYLPRMAARKPALAIKNRTGFRLSGELRRDLSKQYNGNPSSVAVTAILTQLPDKLPNLVEQIFLKEALACYRAGAFRATIVMTWNLAYYHVTEWILADNDRLNDFNAAISKRFPRKTEKISTQDDFDEFKE